jgi:uncharacterized protein YndB with AHSA1/START domain
MSDVQYSVTIEAPAHTVWTTMLEDETYRIWAAEFHAGSHYVGGWQLGDEIRFLGPGDDGTMGGVFGTIVECTPDESVSIEYKGQIIDGVEDTTSPLALMMAGTRESYGLLEVDGTTTVTVGLDDIEDFREMYEQSWPPALAKLKELAEARAV